MERKYRNKRQFVNQYLLVGILAQGEEHVRKSGGIVALIAGIFGVLAAFATLFIGGVGSAVGAEGAETVVGLGWGGVFFSFMVIVLGAVCINARSRVPGVLLVLCSIAGAALGGTFVAVFMVLALLGGILALLGRNKASDQARTTI